MQRIRMSFRPGDGIVRAYLDRLFDATIETCLDPSEVEQLMAAKLGVEVERLGALKGRN